MPDFDPYVPALRELASAMAPSSVLVIDIAPPRLGLADADIVHIPPTALERLPADRVFDLAIVANTLERLPPREGQILLARLRDRQARRLVALVPLGRHTDEQVSEWQLGDLLGFGMAVLARLETESGPAVLASYSIKAYKSTPDWFNNRFWANPERWKP